MRRLRVGLILGILLLFLLGGACVVRQGDRTTLSSEEVVIPAAGIESLALDHQTGDLEIVGEADRTEIRVSVEKRGRVFPNDDLSKYLEGYRFTHQSEAGHLTLRTTVDFKQLGRNGWINLSLQVPAPLAIDVKTGDGKVNIRGLRSRLFVDSRAGDAHYQDLVGPVELKSFAGQVQLEHIRGDCSVQVGSGNLIAADIQGSLEVKGGRPGRMRIQEVEGNLKLWDVLGAIEVDTVQGDLTVLDHALGPLHYEHIQGKITTQ